MPAICFALIRAKVLLAFYIDNIANGRKDEAMTEYAPNLGHAVCFPVRKGIAAVNKDIM